MKTLQIAMMGVLLCATSGCNILGIVAAGTENRSIPAVYELEDKKTLVIVDDPRSVVGDPLFANQVAQVIDNELRQKKVVTETIPLEQWVQFKHDKGETSESTRQMPLTTIGKNLGAEQIVFVFLTEASMSPNPGVWQPTASVKVKVWDVAKSRRAFPASNSAGYPFISKMKASQRSVEGPGSQYVLVREFANYLGEDLSKLFYKHKKPPIGSTFEPMEN